LYSMPFVQSHLPLSSFFLHSLFCSLSLLFCSFAVFAVIGTQIHRKIGMWNVSNSPRQPTKEGENFNIFPAVLLQLELGFIGGKILWF
jgi:hypothetical protein